MATLAVLGCGHRGTAVTAPSVTELARATRSSGSVAADASRTPLRVAVLPIDNESGAAVPVKELQSVVERGLATRFDVVTGPSLESFLSRHRLRYTGGIDGDTARAAREELGLDAILLTTLEEYRAASPPVMGLTMRLVATGEEPAILWMDHAARGGEDRPGLLRLGVLDKVQQVRDVVLGRVFASLDRHLRGEREGRACRAGFFHGPRVRFRSTLLDDEHPHTVAVLPFLNESSRRNAGDLVSLEFVRQLAQTERYRVLEPGVVRDYMLRSRLMVPGGVSLEAARLFLGALGVDIVISGVVIDYAEATGLQGPTIRFSATMLDGGSGELVWNSTSFNRGDDGVFFFGLGRVRTSGDLTCRMVAGVVDRMGERSSADTSPREAGLRGGGSDSRLGRHGSGDAARR